MAKFYESLNEELTAFIQKQHIFFVASAPLSGEGHVNLSPKGHDCLRVLSPNRAAYVDMTGSGNETSAHIRENGRLTFMFCAFEGPPRILRLFGQGRVVLPTDAAWAELSPLFPSYLGTRQIIVIDIQQVQTSCGFAVPLYEYVGERDTLDRWAEAKGDDGLEAYWREKNMCSMDGLPTPLGLSMEETTK